MPERLTFPEAWSTISAPSVAAGETERFTGQRMERIMAIVVAVGAAALGLQAFFAALGGIRHASGAHIALLATVLLLLTAMVVACLVGRWVRTLCGAFAIVYLAALALWPWVVVPDGKVTGPQPWIFFLVNVAAVAAILAFPMPVQILIVLLLPFLYGLVRVAQGEFTQGFWISTSFDVSFTLILGVVLLALGWMFRSVAAGVDDARREAVASYAAAAADAAAEEERVAVAALMHDSVLAALIAAERADSERERELAVAMAREALTRLANTEENVAREGSDAPIAWEQIVVELRRMLSEFGADAVVEVRGDTPPIPERVARAVALAARQACHNAMAHARGRGLHILAEGHAEEGFTITVSDSGPGFDPASIPADRLGLRASVFARMAAVAGAADVVSDENGTVVTLTWRQA